MATKKPAKKAAVRTPSGPHGTEAHYRGGCRHKLCVGAHSDRMRAYRLTAPTKSKPRRI